MSTRKLAKPSFFLLLLSVCLLRWQTAQSYFWSNIGWLQNNGGVERRLTPPHSSIEPFRRAIQANPDNKRAYLGAGVTFAALLQEGSALAAWRAGNISPDLLAQMGIQASDRSLYDVALIYFRSADQLSPHSSGENIFLVGNLCQTLLANLTILTSSNQQYCQNYFAQNDGNLLLNGQFEYDTNWGWRGQFFFNDRAQASLEHDYLSGVPTPSLVLSGLTSGPHNGLYQRISMPPGTRMRFSGFFRTEDAVELNARLLYVEWRQNGVTQGVDFARIESNLEWHYFETYFTLPIGSDPWLQFYPVLLEGQGRIWVDDVRVEVLSGPY